MVKKSPQMRQNITNKDTTKTTQRKSTAQRKITKSNIAVKRTHVSKKLRQLGKKNLFRFIWRIPLITALILISVLSTIEIVERKKITRCISKEMSAAFDSSAQISLGKTPIIYNHLRNNSPDVYFTLHNYRKISGLDVDGVAKDTTISTGISKSIILRSRWDIKEITPIIQQKIYDALDRSIPALLVSLMGPNVQINTQPEKNQLEVTINSQFIPAFITITIGIVAEKNKPVLIIKNSSISQLGVAGLPTNIIQELINDIQPNDLFSLQIPQGFTLEKIWVTKNSVDALLTGENFALNVPDPKNPEKQMTITALCAT